MVTSKTLEKEIVTTGPAYEVVSPPVGSLDERIALLPEGFDFWLPEQLARIRMAKDSQHKYNFEGSWVAVE